MDPPPPLLCPCKFSPNPLFLSPLPQQRSNPASSTDFHPFSPIMIRPFFFPGFLHLYPPSPSIHVKMCARQSDLRSHPRESCFPLKLPLFGIRSLSNYDGVASASFFFLPHPPYSETGADSYYLSLPTDPHALFTLSGDPSD